MVKLMNSPMRNSKITFITLLLFSGFIAQAQTRLDKVRLNLPQEYEWTKQLDRFKNDSTVRIQGWFVENDQGQKVKAAILLSVDRAKNKLSFQEIVNKRLHPQKDGKKVSLLEKGKTSDGYPFALFKVLKPNKYKKGPGSYLVAFVETKTTFHSLSLRSSKSKLPDDLVARWSTILKNPIIAPVSASNSSTAKKSKNRIKAHKSDATYYWTGFMQQSKDEKTPVIVQYHKYDSLSGRYHKQLIVGSINYPTLSEPHKIIGYIQNQRDASLHLYEFTDSGEVIQKLMTGTNGQKMAGYLIHPAEDGIAGAIKLSREDTSTVATEVQVKNDRIFGKYRYSFDQGKITSQMTVQKNADGSVRLTIHTIESDSYRSYFIREESLTLNNQQLNFKAKLMGTSTKLAMQIRFFKGFARVIFTELTPRYDHKYGTQASLAGFYYKIK